MESSVALLQNLDIPSEFRNYNTITESDVIVRLEEWRRQAHKVLGELYEQLKQRESLSRSEKAEIIAAVAPFDGEGSWSLETSRVQAQGTQCVHRLCINCTDNDYQRYCARTRNQRLHSLKCFWFNMSSRHSKPVRIRC